MIPPASITIRYSASSTTALTELTFTPSPHSFPDNVSGRSCLMTCNVFALDTSVAPTTPTSTDTYILTCTLPQPFSMVMTSSSTSLGRPIIGAVQNYQYYPCGPILVNVPEGPQAISYTLSRTDGGEICGAGSTNRVLISLTFTPVQ